MKKPKSVNIFGKTYSITYVDNCSEVHPEGRMGGIMGHCDAFDHEIRAHDSGDPGELLDTLIHECIHAICWELKLNVGDDEHTVGLLGMGIADVLSRNGWLEIDE